MSIDKKQLRRLIKEKSSGLSLSYREEASARIANFVLQSPQFNLAQNIFVYVNMQNEPSTRTIIETAWKFGKNVCVPKCLVAPEMLAVNVSSWDDLAASEPYGILEPKDTSAEIEQDKIDLCIVPCVSAGIKGERLGHGAGFYDKFLCMPATSMCLCFDALISADIPMDAHDVSMDFLVTENGLIETALYRS